MATIQRDAETLSNTESIKLTLTLTFTAAFNKP